MPGKGLRLQLELQIQHFWQSLFLKYKRIGSGVHLSPYDLSLLLSYALLCILRPIRSSSGIM